MNKNFKCAAEIQLEYAPTEILTKYSTVCHSIRNFKSNQRLSERTTGTVRTGSSRLCSLQPHLATLRDTYAQNYAPIDITKLSLIPETSHPPIPRNRAAG
jgi:hypothetical protein